MAGWRRERMAIGGITRTPAERRLTSRCRHVATSLGNYAALLRETGRDAKAENMEARAKAIRVKRAQDN